MEQAPRRMPKYLSPSALSLFEKNPDEYYMSYISPFRAPREAQTLPMSAGSAFDAYAKSYLHEKLFGKNHPESDKYDLEALLKAQVEPQNLDSARKDGAYVFDQYRKSGALSDLMLELNKSVDAPRFEFTVSGVIDGFREGINKTKNGVPLLGKPDIRFINSEGAHVVLDFKLNGFYSKSNTSPTAGYIGILEQTGPDNYMRKGPHKNAYLQHWKGMEINIGSYFNDHDEAWSTQLCTYAWLLGEPVGAETLIGVDQICCNGAKRDSLGRPTLRIAKHRTRISEQFQFTTMHRYQNLWAILTSDPFYFFRDMSFEDSATKCNMLDDQARALGYSMDNQDDEDAWILLQGRVTNKW